MRYAKSVLITLISKGLAIPLGVLASIVTARMLGPSGRGVIAILLVVQGLALQFGSFGFNASITYFIARDKSLTRPVMANALVTALLVGGLISVVFYLIGQFFPGVLLGDVDPLYLTIFLAAIPSSLIILFFQNVFIAHGRMIAFNALDLANRAIQLAGFVVVLVLLSQGTSEAVMTMTGAFVLSSLLYLFTARRLSPLSLRVDRKLFGAMLRYGGRTYLASFLMFALIRSNLFLINLLLGEESSGVYSITLQFTDLLYLLPMTLGMILFPKVSEQLRDTGVLTAKVFRFSLGVISLGVLVLLPLWSPLIGLLYGAEFEGAVLPLMALSPGIVALSLVMILNNDLAGRGLPTVVIIAPLLGLAFNIILHLVLVPSSGLVGSAVSSSASYSLVLFVLYRYFSRSVGIPHAHLLLPRLSDFDPRVLQRREPPQ